MGQRSVHQFLLFLYIYISLPSSTARQLCHIQTKGKTYRIVEVVLLRRLLLVPLDDTELGLILGILHHMPVECLSSATPYVTEWRYLPPCPFGRHQQLRLISP
jgi:hypothetical protein